MLPSERYVNIWHLTVMTGKDISSTVFDICQVPENEEKALRYLQDRVPLQNILCLVPS